MTNLGKIANEILYCKILYCKYTSNNHLRKGEDLYLPLNGNEQRKRAINKTKTVQIMRLKIKMKFFNELMKIN